jgi:light-regulated signal transduction histidine kinase (bacteriophytochrome)
LRLELTISKMNESHLIHIFTDVTAIKEAHLQLERSLEDLRYANKNLEEFAYAASHALKEPVRKMQMFSDRLKEELKGQLNDHQTRLFNRLESAAIRMQTLIDDLLSHSQAAKGSSKLEEVHLNHTIKDVIEDLELEMENKHACVDVQSLPTIRADKRQIQQLFQNLITNALKYSRPDVAPFIKITSTVLRGKDVVKDLPVYEGEDFLSDRNFR